MQFQDFVIPTYQHNHLVKVIYTFTLKRSERSHNLGEVAILFTFLLKKQKTIILTRNSI